MLWEVGVARAMTIGPGALQLSDFVHVDLQGGNLQILEGGSWRHVRAVRVSMPPADQALVMAEVKKDFMIWQSWSFVPRSVHQRMEGGLGYHDVLVFFADGGGQWGTTGEEVDRRARVRFKACRKEGGGEQPIRIFGRAM